MERLVARCQGLSGVHRKGRFFKLARHSSTLSFPDAPDVFPPPELTRLRCMERLGMFTIIYFVHLFSFLSKLLYSEAVWKPLTGQISVLPVLSMTRTATWYVICFGQVDGVVSLALKRIDSVVL